MESEPSLLRDDVDFLTRMVRFHEKKLTTHVLERTITPSSRQLPLSIVLFFVFVFMASMIIAMFPAFWFLRDDAGTKSWYKSVLLSVAVGVLVFLIVETFWPARATQTRQSMDLF